MKNVPSGLFPGQLPRGPGTVPHFHTPSNCSVHRLRYDQTNETMTTTSLFNDTVCVETNQFDTPYNDNHLIPAYSGIMFDVSALTEGIEIWAIEFDVRLEEAANLEVEIFSKTESFTEEMSDEDAWIKVADTQAKATPNGEGVMVTVHDFKPIVLQPMERRAMYIQMKGPWLDIRAEALEKTGEVQKQTDDMVIFVGAGLNSRFADVIDPVVDPQFSGVIHYKKSYQCNEGVLTRVDFPLLISHVPNPVFHGLLQDTFDDILRNKLPDAEHIGDLVSHFDLRFGQTTKIETISSDIDCPENWDYCPTVSTKCILTLRHDDRLRPGNLRFQIYRSAESIVHELGKRLGLTGIAYLGLSPTAATFDMTLHGVGGLLSEKDWDFFEQATTNWLNSEVQQDSEDLRVLDTIASGRIERRYLRSLSDQMSVSGTIFGLQAAFLPLSSFVIETSNGLTVKKGKYVEMLHFGSSTLPNGEVVSSIAFESVSDIRANLKYQLVTSASLEAPSSPLWTFRATMILICVVLAVGLPLLLYYCIKSIKNMKTYEKSLEGYRANMKELRRSKREESSVEATTAKSLEENFTDELDAAFELGYEEYKKKVEVCGLSALSHHELAENETSLHKTSAHGGPKLERSSHSLSLSDLDDDLSASSFETDAEDDEHDNTSVVSEARSVTSLTRTSSERSLLSVFMEKQADKQRSQGLTMSSDHSLMHSSRESLCSQTEHTVKRGMSYMGNRYDRTHRTVGRSRSGNVDIFQPKQSPETRKAPRTKSFDPNVPVDQEFQLNIAAKRRRQIQGQLGGSQRSFSEHLPRSSTFQLCSTKTNVSENTHGDTTSGVLSERRVATQLSRRLHLLLPPSTQATTSSPNKDKSDRPALLPTRTHSSSSMKMEKIGSEKMRARPRRESRVLIPPKSCGEILRAPLRTAPVSRTQETKIRKAPGRNASAPSAPCLHLSIRDDEVLHTRECLAEEFLDSDVSSSSSTKETSDSTPSSEEKTSKKKETIDKFEKKLTTLQRKASKHNSSYRSEGELSGTQSLDEKSSRASGSKRKKKTHKSKKRETAKKKSSCTDVEPSSDCDFESSGSDCELSVGAQSLDENILVYGKAKSKKKRSKSKVKLINV